MLELHERFSRDDPDPELLAQLARQRRLMSLASTAFATRKLPEAGHWTIGRATIEQHLATGILDKRSNDVDAPTIGHDERHYKRPWQCLNFFPDPQGHGWFLPTLGSPRTKGATGSAGGGVTPSGARAPGGGAAAGAAVNDGAAAC